jgi:iron complex outermembrane receptor protein
LLLAHNAWGQEGISDFEELDLEELLDVVVTAAKHKQSIAESPSAVTVITREEIENSGARSLPEILRMVPNMDIGVLNPLWYEVGVRGNSSINSDSMLLLVDNRDATVEFMGFPAWTLQSFNMEEVERIEVIRGPGSALYGANAYAGVVHVITRDPGTGPRAVASLRGAEYGAFELSLRLSETFGPVAVAIGAGLEQADFWTNRDQESFATRRIRGDVKIDLGENLAVRLDGGLFNTTGRFQTYAAPLDMDDHMDAYGRVRFDAGDLSLTAAYSLFYVEGLMDMGLVYNGIEIGRLPYLDGRVDKITTQAQHTLEFFHNRLIYGVEYIYNTYHSDILIDPDLDEHRFGFFLQDEVDLKGIIKDLFDAENPPALTLTAGLRLDVNSITQLAVSPRAALVYRLSDNHSFRLGYAQAFRKPTFMETSMHLHLEGGVGIDELDVRNGDLKNRHIYALDAGYTGTFFEGKLLIRLDAAYTWYRDMIYFDVKWDEIEYINIGGIRLPDINSDAIGFFNRKNGFNGHTLELQADARPVEWFRAFFTLAYRQVFDQWDNKFRTQEPVWKLIAGADLKPAAGWKLSLRAFASDAYRRTIYSPEGLLEDALRGWIPSYWFLNARLAWNVAEKPFGMQVGVEAFNLFDKRFREFIGYTDPNGIDYGGEMIGRRITLFVRGEI